MVGAVVTFLDVTEKRRTQIALLQKEARFRQLTEASFEGVSVAANGVILEANQGFADIFGYTVDEVIGRSTMDFVAPESDTSSSGNGRMAGRSPSK